ncbi:DUF1987 domain-containing protein [uncultured Microscilla sp.]|uniref:DUF1987 domain-containing protein n=1 Tax=uncultured Microscilla sp. TaxID=432653 RepID=UPI00261C6BD4|nr:DUF1987 domain-containing protein [uncultured Microscilla sp.]
MKDIAIKGNKGVYFIPTVNFNSDTGVCEIIGESYHQDAKKFYRPLIQWVEEYIQSKHPIRFDFKLTYFNTNSSKAFLNILKVLKKYADEGGQVEANWYYPTEDDDILEEAEDFIQETKLKMNLIGY